jgi:hypothetical protein
MLRYPSCLFLEKLAWQKNGTYVPSSALECRMFLFKVSAGHHGPKVLILLMPYDLEIEELLCILLLNVCSFCGVTR